MNLSLLDFLADLSSKNPTPGGGGASALIGAIGASLCSMVANLTSGKQKYAQHQSDIENILSIASQEIPLLIGLIEKDAETFEPLAKAYGIPKEDPDREGILEGALVAACSVPMETLAKMEKIVSLVEELAEKGSRLAVSDIGVAAAACRAAMEGAAMNVYINTKLMKNRERAEKLNAEANGMLESGANRCAAVYQKIAAELGGQ